MNQSPTLPLFKGRESKKIVLIGSGTPKPLKNWESIENIIRDYKDELEKQNHQVYIFNLADYELLIKSVNELSPDIVHLYDPKYINIISEIECPVKAVTFNTSYIQHPQKLLEQMEKSNNLYKNSGLHKKLESYQKILKPFLDSDVYIFCLSKEIKEIFLKNNFPEPRLKLLPNGVRKDLFRFSEVCTYPDKSICLAKIDSRKRQYILQHCDANIDFVGAFNDNKFNTANKNYLGEWDRTTVFENLTNYANLVMISDGEAHSLSCLEALVSGLGLVISEFATANLDLSKEFIDVIPESKIRDKDYVRAIVENNRKKSILLRKEIRQYALNNFDLEVLSKRYVEMLKATNC